MCLRRGQALHLHPLIREKRGKQARTFNLNLLKKIEKTALSGERKKKTRLLEPRKKAPEFHSSKVCGGGGGGGGGWGRGWVFGVWNGRADVPATKDSENHPPQTPQKRSTGKHVALLNGKAVKGRTREFAKKKDLSPLHRGPSLLLSVKNYSKASKTSESTGRERLKKTREDHSLTINLRGQTTLSKMIVANPKRHARWKKI